VSVTLALTVADLAVLIYFLGHITTQIQLPQVIARIAGDLAEAMRSARCPQRSMTPSPRWPASTGSVTACAR
jgi:uncharacterized membrane protein